jgi:hypothetical protein
MNAELPCAETTIFCSHPKTVGELEDELKARDRRIEELRREIDEQRELISRFRDHAEDYDSCMERWRETFGMQMTDDGKWTWEPFWDEHWKTVDDYNDLVRDWNRFLPLINGHPRPVGRPLEASEAQVAEVLRLRKTGRSLRGIADDTSLALHTVRTIVAKSNTTDRTTQKHRERIGLDRFRLASQRRQRRTGAALPRQAQRVVEAGQKLIKEAKGLGRAR